MSLGVNRLYYIRNISRNTQKHKLLFVEQLNVYGISIHGISHRAARKTLGVIPHLEEGFLRESQRNLHNETEVDLK